MTATRILLADDHTIVAQGLGALLREEFDLVGKVADGAELIEAARRLQPDVIVSDISMPGISGLDALRRLKAESCRSKIIFLTMHADTKLAVEALRAGASGYILKQSAGEELMAAIREVLQDRIYLTPRIAKEVLAEMGVKSAARQLTPRQLDVLRLVAQGRTLKETAAALGISRRTVETHKYEMMQTLGVETTAELIRYAIKHETPSN